jgi:hypothetical protein
VVLAGVAPDDRFHCRVGFRRRRIHADGLALDQPALRRTLQRPSEDSLM